MKTFLLVGNGCLSNNYQTTDFATVGHLIADTSFDKMVTFRIEWLLF